MCRRMMCRRMMYVLRGPSLHPGARTFWLGGGCEDSQLSKDGRASGQAREQAKEGEGARETETEGGGGGGGRKEGGRGGASKELKKDAPRRCVTPHPVVGAHERLRVYHLAVAHGSCPSARHAPSDLRTFIVLPLTSLYPPPSPAL